MKSSSKFQQPTISLFIGDSLTLTNQVFDAAVRICQGVAEEFCATQGDLFTPNPARTSMERQSRDLSGPEIMRWVPIARPSNPGF
jgi:hypothetical protein